jgi:hypothetical protein
MTCGEEGHHTLSREPVALTKSYLNLISPFARKSGSHKSPRFGRTNDLLVSRHVVKMCVADESFGGWAMRI